MHPPAAVIAAQYLDYPAYLARLRTVPVQDLLKRAVGEPYDALEIPADPGQTIIAYSAEPGSAAHQALGILASWAATQPRAGRLNTAEPPDGHTPGSPATAPGPDARAAAGRIPLSNNIRR